MNKAAYNKLQAAYTIPLQRSTGFASNNNMNLSTSKNTARNDTKIGRTNPTSVFDIKSINEVLAEDPWLSLIHI